MCYILYGDNMNKKGFTLIELMAVIVILSVIAVITTPVIINVVSNVRSELSKQQKQIIENAARMWGVKELSLEKQEDGNYKPSQTRIPISKLKQNNYLEDKEINNLTEEELNKAGVCISYEDNQYIYKFIEDIENCDS